ncbi:MAG: hypothetical protein ACMUHY_08200 [Thermoplasmatota archaeon]
MNGSLIVKNATLQLEYRTSGFPEELQDRIVQDFHWTINGKNHTIDWSPAISTNDTIDDIELFSDEEYTKDQISTVSLYLKICSSGFLAPSLELDRVWMIIDHIAV